MTEKRVEEEIDEKTKKDGNGRIKKICPRKRNERHDEKIYTDLKK